MLKMKAAHRGLNNDDYFILGIVNYFKFEEKSLVKNYR